VAEVPVALDWSRREGASKLRVLPTVGGYARLMMRNVAARERV
jgi:dolichol-phosphate mannosyltransferase